MFRASKLTGHEKLRFSLQHGAALPLTWLMRFYPYMNDESTHREDAVLQNEVLTVKEVAAYLRVSRVTVWRLCQRGTLRALRVGRHWRICREDLLDFVRGPQPPRLIALDSSTVAGDGKSPGIVENPEGTGDGPVNDLDDVDS